MYQILTGVAAGIMYSLTGFAKQKGEKFDLEKFSYTVILGAVIGVGGMLYNLPFAEVETIAINIGAVALIENIIKAIKRKFF